ncbi:MAG: DUF4179 domain-containing protein [Firmicutes bacterium]|nr:DUF4179 domain-containing protein [Bacillota bacterium]
MNMDLEQDLRKLGENNVLSEQLKDKLIDQMEAAGSSYRSRKHRPMVVGIIVAFILGLAAVGYATGILSPSTLDALKEGLGDSEEQEMLIEKLGEPLDISATVDGITVTAEAMLNDGKCLAILFKVSRDDGEPLLPADTEDLTGVIFRSYDADDTSFRNVMRPDNQFPFLMYEPGDKEGYLMHFAVRENETAEYYYPNFGYLSAWYDDSHRAEPLTEHNGFWHFEIPVKTVCEYKEFAQNTVFEEDGEEYRIDVIRVSPLSITVDYTVLSDTPSNRVREADFTAPNGTAYHVDQYLNTDPFWENINLALRLKDGSLIDLSSFMNGYFLNPMGYVEDDWEEDVFIVHREAALPEITALEDMDCVIFNDVEYKIND